MPSSRALAALALAALAGAFGPAAHAASRLVIHLDTPAVVSVDGATLPLPAGSSRAVVNHIIPGPHAVEFRTPTGALEQSVVVDVPADTEVVGRYATGQGLVLTSGGSVRAGTTAVAVSGAPAGPPPPAAPPPSTTFDANEGPAHGQRLPTEGRAGNPEGAAQTIGTVGRVVGGTVAPGATFVVGTAAPAVARGAASLARNAEAGGLSALSGSGPTFRQGRPVPPKVDTGAVDLVSTDGGAYLVFLEGFLLAELGPGRPKANVKLEVGRHLLEIWDASTMVPTWKGVVTIDKNVAVPIELGGGPPRAPTRSWAWQAR